MTKVITGCLRSEVQSMMSKIVKEPSRAEHFFSQTLNEVWPDEVGGPGSEDYPEEPLRYLLDNYAAALRAVDPPVLAKSLAHTVCSAELRRMLRLHVGVVAEDIMKQWPTGKSMLLDAIHRTIMVKMDFLLFYPNDKDYPYNPYEVIEGRAHGGWTNDGQEAVYAVSNPFGFSTFGMDAGDAHTAVMCSLHEMFKAGFVLMPLVTSKEWWEPLEQELARVCADNEMGRGIFELWSFPSGDDTMRSLTVSRYANYTYLWPDPTHQPRREDVRNMIERAVEDQDRRDMQHGNEPDGMGFYFPNGLDEVEDDWDHLPIHVFPDRVEEGGLYVTPDTYFDVME